MTKGNRAAAAPWLPAFAAVGLLAFAALAVRAPLAVYTVALAAFGLPHVLSELRYVDRRFGRRLARRWLVPMAVLLPAIVAVRAATVFHLVSPQLDVPLELAGVAALALACAGGSARQRGLALAVGGTLGGATALAPYGTAVALSILHNLTPLGFLWQIVPRPRRTVAMLGAAGAFLGLPLLVATGWPRTMLGDALRADPLGAGPLAAHLFVYVPPAVAASAHAVDFFTASVVAQGAHYTAVILLLPALLRRLDPAARGLAPWPNGWWLALICVAAGAVGLLGAGQSFAETRALYGIAASFHAWLEVPVLIVALGGAVQSARTSPARNEPPLATSDTSIARSSLNRAIQAMRPPSTSTTAASSAMSDGQ